MMELLLLLLLMVEYCQWLITPVANQASCLSKVAISNSVIRAQTSLKLTLTLTLTLTATITITVTLTPPRTLTLIF